MSSPLPMSVRGVFLLSGGIESRVVGGCVAITHLPSGCRFRVGSYFFDPGRTVLIHKTLESADVIPNAPSTSHELRASTFASPPAQSRTGNGEHFGGLAFVQQLKAIFH